MDAPAQPSRRRLFTGDPAGDPIVHVASFVVRAFPDRMPQVIRAIEAAGDFEIAAREASKLVLLVEASHERVIVDRLAELEAIPGVLGAVLVYHHMETAAQLAEEMPDAADPT